MGGHHNILVTFTISYWFEIFVSCIAKNEVKELNFLDMRISQSES